MAARSDRMKSYLSRVALPCSGNGCGEWAASHHGVRDKVTPKQSPVTSILLTTRRRLFSRSHILKTAFTDIINYGNYIYSS
jgi:hypothetical protein